MRRPTWFELEPDYSVLEFDAWITLPGPALELHLLASERFGLLAWWVTDRGDTLTVADVGLA